MRLELRSTIFLLSVGDVKGVVSRAHFNFVVSHSFVLFTRVFSKGWPAKSSVGLKLFFFSPFVFVNEREREKKKRNPFSASIRGQHSSQKQSLAGLVGESSSSNRSPAAFGKVECREWKLQVGLQAAFAEMWPQVHVRGGEVRFWVCNPQLDFASGSVFSARAGYNKDVGRWLVRPLWLIRPLLRFLRLVLI